MSEQLTPRPEWKMPEPPRDGLIPCAHAVGPDDGWDLYWATTDEPNEWADDGANIPWPFADDAFASVWDMRRAGFTYVD